MNLSKWAINNPLPFVLFFILASILGALSFNRLPVQNMPDIDLPAISINVAYPGVKAKEIEVEITKKIEESLSSLSDIKSVSSTISEGVSSTVVEFELNSDSNLVLQEVKDAVAKIKGEFPADVLEPSVEKIKTASRPLVAYALSSKDINEQDLTYLIKNYISNEIRSIKGIASISLAGERDGVVEVILDPQKLYHYSLTSAEVSSLIKNYTLNTPSGSVNQTSGYKTLVTSFEIKNIKELQELKIPVLKESFVELKEIATIEVSKSNSKEFAYFNGKPVISLEVSRNSGASDIDVFKEVESKIESLKQKYPSIEFEPIYNNVNRAKRAFDSSIRTLYEGTILAIVVVWFFLRDWRATLVSAVALPLSILPTFYLLEVFLGFTLNTLTLLALTLVIGILVDDAIVEIENMEKHLAKGKAPLQAAADAAQEIGLAVIATTFTLIAVFLPTAFMGGIPGKFFNQFGWTAAISVFLSLLVARFLTPVMAAYFMKPKKHSESPKKESKTMSFYLKVIEWTTYHYIKTILISVVILVGSLFLASKITTEFIPASDESQINLTVKTHTGLNSSDLLQLESQIRSKAHEVPEVVGFYAKAGNKNESVDISLIISLKDLKNRSRSQKEIEKDLISRLSNIPFIKINNASNRSGEVYPLTLKSYDMALLEDTAQKLQTQLESLGVFGSIANTANTKKSEIILSPKEFKLAYYGISPSNLGQQVRSALVSEKDSMVGKLEMEGRIFYIKTYIENKEEQSLEKLSNLMISTPKGLIALKELADLEQTQTVSVLKKYDKEFNITLNISLNDLKLGQASKIIEKEGLLKNLPKGVSLVDTGELQRMKELFSSFGLAMLTGIMCVYLVLVLLFKSFLHPFTILMALPLSFGGAFGSLLLFDYSFSMPVLIGLLMLMGIATKNSILLVDVAIVKSKEGVNLRDSVLIACKERVRPIIMTSVAMIAGMLPLSLGLDGDTFKAPMAIAVIGGLTTSTLLSLVVIPSIYIALESLKRKLVSKLT